MRTFLMVFLMVFVANSVRADEAPADNRPTVKLYDTVELKVVNRALNGGKESCQAGGGMFTVVSQDSKQVLLEYTADAAGGCPTGSMSIATVAEFQQIKVRSANHESHRAVKEALAAKEFGLPVAASAKVRLIDAADDKGIDWGNVQSCQISRDATLSYRAMLKMDGYPSVAFLHQSSASPGNGACPDKSTIIVRTSDLEAIFGISSTVQAKAP